MELQDNGVLEKFPASFAALKNVRLLNISNTAFPRVPAEVQHWANLTDIVATRNTQFEDLPGTAPSLPFLATRVGI